MNNVIAMEVGVSGHYRLTVHSEARGSRVVAEFDNLITDYGLNRLGTAAVASHCQVGTGTATPNVLDTALVTWVASAPQFSITGAAQSSSPYFSTAAITYRFTTGAVVGNMAEVGISNQNTNGNLFSRARILDGGGNPTTITVLVDETLDVEYSFRIYPPTVDVTGAITISAVSYDYIIRACRVTTYTDIWSAINFLSGLITAYFDFNRAYDGVIAAITANPSGNADSSTSCAMVAYGNNNLYRDMTQTWSLSDGNLAGSIKTVTINIASAVNFQCQFTPVLPKDATKVLTLTFRLTWARH